MLNKLCYKGFASTPLYSIEEKVIYGHVDDYLDTCEELGIHPEPKVKVLA